MSIALTKYNTFINFINKNGIRLVIIVIIRKINDLVKTYPQSHQPPSNSLTKTIKNQTKKETPDISFYTPHGR